MIIRTFCSLLLILSVIKLHECLYEDDSWDTSRNTSTYPIDSLDYVILLDHKYFFSDFLATWFDALTFCRNYGMELVSVETVTENNQIKNYLQSLEYATGDPGFFTSGHKLGRGQIFKWADGTPINWAIQDWCAGEPSNERGSQYCLEYLNADFCWNDRQCGTYIRSDTGAYDFSVRYFICEEKIS